MRDRVIPLHHHRAQEPQESLPGLVFARRGKHTWDLAGSAPANRHQDESGSTPDPAIKRRQKRNEKKSGRKHAQAAEHDALTRGNNAAKAAISIYLVRHQKLLAPPP